MRVTLVISSLAAGGAQRVMLDLGRHLAEQGHTVSLFTFSAGSDDFFVVPRGIERRALGLLGRSPNAIAAVARNARRLLVLRKAIAQTNADVVVSFIDITNIAVILATVGLGMPTIISERIHPRVHPIGVAWDALRRATYPFCTRLVVQTEAVAEWARRVLPLRKIVVIPNAVPQNAIDPVQVCDRRERIVLAVGRLDPQKGFDLLIRSFAVSALSDLGWRLIIVGEGSERTALRQLSSTLGVADAVEMPGQTADPAKLMLTAAIFALSSRYEGFPNVLLEAMACGAAPVAFDCPSGPKEIIEQGINGWLVPAGDVKAFGAAMALLANDHSLRHRLSKAARDVTRAFAPDIVLARWVDLLESTATRARPRQ